MSGVQTLKVADDEAGIRLDRWFRRHFPDLSHGRLEKLLRKGEVRVDGGRAKSNVRLEAGQQVRIPPLPADAGTVGPRPITPSKTDPRDAKAVRDMVIYRDDAVLALNKPAGLAVQGGSGIKRHLDGMLDALKFDSKERPRLVHRLDKDTSGVLLLGRTAAAAAALAAAFKARETEKTYWAIVCGVPKPRFGRIDAPLAKSGGRGNEKMRIDEVEGRRAVTDFATVESAGKEASWLALRPVTGRTHQIRAHCAAIGTPILGDGKYGGAEAFLAGMKLARQLHLHARAISIKGPDGRRIDVEAPLPPHFAQAMRLLGFNESDYQDPFADPDELSITTSRY
jgi:23S rRNA pseudouridine955/2504/2580 synthase